MGAIPMEGQFSILGFRGTVFDVKDHKIFRHDQARFTMTVSSGANETGGTRNFATDCLRWTSGEPDEILKKSFFLRPD